MRAKRAFVGGLRCRLRIKELLALIAFSQFFPIQKPDKNFKESVQFAWFSPKSLQEFERSDIKMSQIEVGHTSGPYANAMTAGHEHQLLTQQ